MNNNVDTEQLNGLALEIKNNITSLKQILEDIINEISKIRSSSTTLRSFNDQKVTGTERIDFQTPNSLLKFRVYSQWKISGSSEIIEVCNTILNELEEQLDNGVVALLSETSNIELIASAIDGYIQKIQTELGDSITPEQLALAFKQLSGANGENSKIAWDEYQAAAGKFISSDKIKNQYWTDKPLKFVLQPNGTYLIMQQDDQGNWTGMGFTTALAAVSYIRKLEYITTPLIADPVKPIEEAKESIDSQNEKNSVTTQSESTSYASIKKELVQYGVLAIKHLNDYNDPEVLAAYNNLSPEAKAIVDGKIRIISNDEVPSSVQKELLQYKLSQAQNNLFPNASNENGNNISSSMIDYDNLSTEAKNILEGNTVVVPNSDKIINEKLQTVEGRYELCERYKEQLQQASIPEHAITEYETKFYDTLT